MTYPENPEAYKTVDHLFRHEAGKMVAVLTRLFGFPNIEQAEDIVQDTILKALEIWKWGKVPEHPQAWLYKTAKNAAIDVIRKEKLRYKIENELSILLKSEYSLAPVIHELFTAGEIRDSQLRMMFACGHPSIAHESQVTLILKTLCGLSVREIANAFLTREETIQKRLFRTREKIREEKIELAVPSPAQLESRLQSVLHTLYLLFNEGYSSSHSEKFIREELCEEAMRLTLLLTENKITALPQVFALLALMCYHTSRFEARVNDNGFIVLLEDQDRSRWNRSLIAKGNEYLALAAEGEMIHDFHIEAAIASLHANASTFESTDWKLILTLYDRLMQTNQSPVVALNRWLVVGHIDGSQAALDGLLQLQPLRHNSYYHAALGELYFKLHDKTSAKESYRVALEITNSEAEKELLLRKMKGAE
jgi:RNA polymerase sigma factor (sigma-70 family)